MQNHADLQARTHIFFVVQPGSWCKEGRIEKEVYISLLPNYPYFFVQLG